MPDYGPPPGADDLRWGIFGGLGTTGAVMSVSWLSQTFAMFMAAGAGSLTVTSAAFPIAFFLAVLAPVIRVNRNYFSDIERQKFVDDWWKRHEAGDPSVWDVSIVPGHEKFTRSGRGTFVSINYDQSNPTNPWSLQSGYRHVNMRRKGGAANWKSKKMEMR